MKTLVNIEYKYDGAFLDVARMIANGPPPYWLLCLLTHFGKSIGTDISSKEMAEFKDEIDRMRNAAATLQRLLPAFWFMGQGVQPSKDFVMVLKGLPGVRKELERLSERQSYRTADANRAVCAAVVVEAWSHIRGEKVRSGKLIYEACEAYWVACGGEPMGLKGSVEGIWRRRVADADEWMYLIRLVSEAFRSELELRRSPLE